MSGVSLVAFSGNGRLGRAVPAPYPGLSFKPGGFLNRPMLSLFRLLPDLFPLFIFGAVPPAASCPPAAGLLLSRGSHHAALISS